MFTVSKNVNKSYILAEVFKQSKFSWLFHPPRYPKNYRIVQTGFVPRPPPSNIPVVLKVANVFGHFASFAAT